MLQPLACALAMLVAAMPLAAPAMLEERLTIELDSGRSVETVIRRPKKITAPLPTVVLIGGFKRGVDALDLLPPRENLIFVGLDYPADVPRRIRWWQIPALARELERGIADTREALGLLHERLKTRPDVDAARISIAGVSFGAPFAIMAAADHAYPGLVIAHGFADVPRVIRHQFIRKWEPKYGVAGRVAAWLAERGITLLIDIPDPELFAERLRANQDVLLIDAAHDDFIPPEATAALLQALGRSEARLERQTTAGKHVRGHQAEAVEELYKLVEKWLHRLP